ncbi:hypothetical protein MTR_1g015710 [Medicago truncatula]|uniref:Uncharacterized protein n=1 Tax=Medicago truncatula TaxID=3880 RepID=G7I9U5_MEDTR|nr:hypothetical protein MTR_1g015710 [Medicago truncatula]
MIKKYEIDATLAVQQARYNVKRIPKCHNTAAELEHQSRTGTAEGQKKATAEPNPFDFNYFHLFRIFL